MKLQGKGFSDEFHWVVGEGEQTAGAFSRGERRHLSEYGELDDLDDLPFTDFSGFDLSRYSRCLPLLSSRGCVRPCRFCTERLLYRKFRRHSPSYMVDLIESLIRKHGTNTHRGGVQLARPSNSRTG